MPPDDDKEPKDEPKTFTQAELDKIVGDRITRERAKFADYDETKAKASKFDELDAQSKTDVEKAGERAAAAEKKAEAAEARALRLEIATAKGLNAAQAKRLVGTTKEELEADADEILESFKPADGEKPAPHKPTADLKGGGDPTGDEEVNVREVVDSIPRGF